LAESGGGEVITVKFIDVGQEKRNWTSTCAEISFNWLYRQVKSNGALMSGDLSFKNEHGKGTIYEGFCAVGRFEVVTEIVTKYSKERGQRK